jgi:DNA-nicking Smr family endonuclease
VKKKNTVSKKNKKDWEDFTKQIGDIRPKEDDLLQKDVIIEKIKKLDLHGSSLNDANYKVNEFINDSFEKGYRKILIVTGKGSRSNVDGNPYISGKFGVLKYSIPEFIKNEENLNKKVIKISVAEKKHGGEGAIYVFLKKTIKE